MRILFFIASLTNSAGTERISTSLANALSTNGCQVDFVVNDSDTRHFFSLSSSINVYSLGLDKNIGEHIIKAAFRLSSLIKRERYDIILNVGVACACITFLAFPWVYGCRVFSWEHFSMKSTGYMGKLKRWISAFLSNHTIVLTHADLKAYPRLLQKKLDVIPNFTSINKDLQISQLDSNIVLAAGRIEGKIKGFDLLVEAWKEVITHYPDWTLRIVGGGNPYELTQIIKEQKLEKSVKLTGSVEEMGLEYLNSSIFVLSSRSEPFGLVLIEAMSFGVPVVSFDCPNGPREIINDGIDGKLVENGSVKALAAAVMEMIADEDARKRMGKAAIQKYRNKYTIDKILLMWLSVLN